MSVEDLKASRGEPKAWFLFVILMGVGGILWLNWWLLQGVKERGTFGDMFGGVNALFSGAAFSVLAFTLLLQRYELKLQREELAETRKVMESQREQMELQAKTQQLQQFENTFFQLIKVHGDIVQHLEVYASGTRFEGQRALNYCTEFFKTKYMEMGGSAHGSNEEARIREAYNRMYTSYEPQLGSYLRHVYHIIKFIDENPQVNRRRYRSFFRAQLSSQEAMLLFYNCLSEHGAGTKPFVEKYGMLKNLRESDLITTAHKSLYDRQAFMPTQETVE